MIPTFDIFRGAPDKDAMWVEAVEGLGTAFDRMKELATESPGPYFVFDTKSHNILAFINTAQTAKADGWRMWRSQAYAARGMSKHVGR